MPHIKFINPYPQEYKNNGATVFLNVKRSMIVTSLDPSHEAVATGIISDNGKYVTIDTDSIVGFHTNGWYGWKPYEEMYPQVEVEPQLYGIVSMTVDPGRKIMSLYLKTAEKFRMGGLTQHSFFMNHCGVNNARVLNHILLGQDRSNIFNKEYSYQNFGTSTVGIKECIPYHQDMIHKQNEYIFNENNPFI